jgi:hypothetical protein
LRLWSHNILDRAIQFKNSKISVVLLDVGKQYNLKANNRHIAVSTGK